MSAKIKKAHELRYLDRVLIYQSPTLGASPVTVISVADASFAGVGLLDVAYQFDGRYHAKSMRVSRETVFPFLGGANGSAT